MQNPNVYEITDPDTGKTYRMEADEGVTQEQALADFEALGRDQWAAFEYKPTPVQTTKQASAPSTPQGSEPVAVSAAQPAAKTPAAPKAPAMTGAPTPVATEAPIPQAEMVDTVQEGFLLDTKDPRSPYEKERSEAYSIIDQMMARGDADEAIIDFALSQPEDLMIDVKALDKDLAWRRESATLEKMFQSGASDDEIRQYAQSIEGVNVNMKSLEENLEFRKKFGADANRNYVSGSGVTIQDTPIDQAFEPEQPEDPGERQGLERLVDSFQDAIQYGFNGLMARTVNDWANTSKDQLRTMFPGREEEWYEQMHDWAVVRTQKKMRAEAAMLQEMDPNWRPDENFVQNVLAAERWGPWFLGQMAGSIGPESAIAPGASLTSRGIAQVGVGSVASLGYQGLDVAAGVQDEVSLADAAFEGLVSGALEVGFTGAARAVGLDSARGKGVNSTEVQNARFPRALDPLDQTIPTRSTQNRRTKAYRTETVAAQTAIADRVNSLTSEWSNSPNFEVRDSFRNDKDLDNNGLGVYRSDGTVVLNTEAILNYAERSNLTPDDVVRSVVFHEGLGHHGLASRYGDELDDTMLSFYTNGDADFRARVDAYMALYKEKDTTLAVEETLAKMSERGELPIRIMDRLVTFFRGWAREIPWVGQHLKFTDNEVRTLLALSQRETTSGDYTLISGNKDKYIKIYHGSPNDFAPTADNPLGEFDHSFMGAGEGVQAFGWGTYGSDSYKIADERYRQRLSEKTYSWNGVPGNWYDIRRNAGIDAQRRFDAETQIIVDDALTYYGSTGAPSKEGFAEWMGVPEILSDPSQPYAKLLNEAYDFLEGKIKVETKGKVYEVDIPDDTKFLEWELPLKEQPDLEKALNDAGYRITNYSEWNKLNREAYEARKEYDYYRNSLFDLDATIKRLEETGETPENIPFLERQADELFQRLQQAELKKNEAVGRASSYFHDEMSGEDVYKGLTAVLKSDKEASLLLESKGINGNRYLADNLTRKKDRGDEGSDVFNYVIFNDKRPKITNKYMKPAPDDADPFLRIDELTPEELFESQNAFEILDRIVPKSQSTVMNMEQLQAEAAARKVPPSALLRLVEKEPGFLARSLFMHDIALVKAGERVAELNARINSGNYTMQDKDNFVKAIMSYEDLTKRIFGMGSEFGLALRAMQEVQYTKKKLTTIRNALSQLDNPMAALEDPATFEKFARDVSAMMAEANENVKKGQNPFLSTLNIPRALMSSMDLSAPLRQGLFFIGNKAYFRAAADMHKLFVSDKAYYDTVMGEIASRPTHVAMLEGKVAFSSVDNDAPLSARDEDFQTSFADSVPGVARSNRAFSGFRNKLSADMFDNYFNLAQKAGANVGKLQPDENGKMVWVGDEDAKANLRKIGALINAGTGRGNLPQVLQAAAPLLNAMFFSPRLMASRLNLLNPVMYYKLPAGVRRAAIIRAASVGAFYATFLTGLTYFFPEIEVENDPRKSDFGKVKVGNTRYDVLGGFGQYITLGARLATGQKVSSADRVTGIQSSDMIESIHEGVRGLLTEVGIGSAESYEAEPANEMFDSSLISDFLQNKLSPNASYLNEMFFTGETFDGERFDPIEGALSRMMPMYFQDMKELTAREEPGAVGKTLGVIGGMYGVGVSTYIPKSLDPEQELEAPETMKDKDLADGDNEWVTVKDGVITLKPKAKEAYTDRLNLYFSQIMDYEMKEEGWNELKPEDRAAIIKDAKDEARREARKDMRVLYGVD